jgi:hypothetical protein
MRELAVAVSVAVVTAGYLRADITLIVAALVLGLSAGFALRASR